MTVAPLTWQMPSRPTQSSGRLAWAATKSVSSFTLIGFSLSKEGMNCAELTHNNYATCIVDFVEELS